MGGSELDSYPASLESTEETAFGSLFYIRGVGTSGSKYQEAVQAITGSGVIERIAIAYRWFCQTYVPGSTVAVFGFSRGAFSARSFCGLLNSLGVPEHEITLDQAKNAVNKYLDGGTSGSPVPIQYLGIFDTVGATVERELEHHLSPSNVKFARHAMAIDETRKSYLPCFWHQPESQTNIREAWFTGSHSNVGGGYPNKHLSNIAQFWILKGLERSGIQIHYPDFAGFDGEKVGEGLIDSWRGWIHKLPPISKAIANGFKIHWRRREIQQHHSIHESVFEAMGAIQTYLPKATLSGSPLSRDLQKTHLAPWEFH